MNGVSGCFGGTPTTANETIDNVEEVSAAVDDIINDTTTNEENTRAAFVLAQHYAFMEQRVKMLTWVVVALAAVIVMKEL